MTLAAYACEHGLTKYDGWKWARKFTKNNKKFIRLVKVYKAQAKKFDKRFKFVVRVPNTVKEAVELDTANGNTLWQEAIGKETGQLFE